MHQIRVHETAHLLRRDDVALLIQRIVEAFFALHLVVRWITRHIDLEREIACDDFVLEQTGKARPYASCLTRVVEIAGGMRSSIVTSAVARLLKLQLLLVVAALVALACIAVRTPGIVAFAAAEQDLWFEQAPAPPELPSPSASPEAPAPREAPAVPDPPAPPAAPDPPAAPQTSWPDSHNHRIINWRTNDGLHSRQIRVRGDVHFNDEETEIATMSPGGFFSYEESYGFTSRRYQATADSSAQIKRAYLIDGREKPLDADGKAWLRAAIPDLLRESGIDAPERVRRILKQGGVPAVLAEIAKIHSDGTKRVYIREFVPIGNPSLRSSFNRCCASSAA